MEQLIIGELTIDVIRKEIKNMHLAVYPPTGRVRLAAPLTVSDESLRLFAISKLGWIKRHQRHFARQERETPREYIDRESHYFNGKRYLLRVRETQGPIVIQLNGKRYLDLYVKANSQIEQREKALHDWQRAHLKKHIPLLIEKYEASMGVEVRSWGVKRMKTKWGSCNREAGRIWLNLELAKKPLACLEYIVVHEMVHLLERHHNARFMSLMDRFLPNWRQLRDELNRLPVAHADWGY